MKYPETRTYMTDDDLEVQSIFAESLLVAILTPLIILAVIIAAVIKILW